jgi:hypothetical protein
MKAFVVVVLFLIISNAQASWMATKCSNSDGSVVWERGHDQNIIHLKYSNFVAGTLTLDMEQVKIDMRKEITIREKKIHNCNYAAITRVYAGKVSITASEKHPYVLQGQFPLNRVETEVICTHMVNNLLRCQD